jgi:hypothetical protein
VRFSAHKNQDVEKYFFQPNSRLHALVRLQVKMLNPTFSYDYTSNRTNVPVFDETLYEIFGTDIYFIT